MARHGRHDPPALLRMRTLSEAGRRFVPRVQPRCAGPDGGRAAFDGRHGSMKAGGRTMTGGYRIQVQPTSIIGRRGAPRPLADAGMWQSNLLERVSESFSSRE